MNKQFWHLSAGQRTRVSILKSLLNDPELIMMDEPTASLDPDIRDKVISLIETIRKERSLSILFTSHNMDEVTRICDDVIFLDQGKIIRHQKPEELAAEVYRPSIIISFTGDANVVVSHLSQLIQFDIEIHNYTTNQVTLALDTADVPFVIGSFANLNGITVTDLDIRKPSLEDAFLHFSRSSS